MPHAFALVAVAVASSACSISGSTSISANGSHAADDATANESGMSKHDECASGSHSSVSEERLCCDSSMAGLRSKSRGNESEKSKGGVDGMDSEIAAAEGG